MQIRDFARAVLSSATLDDKLVVPGALTDEQPGPALVDLPDLPGRPEALRLDREGRSPFPRRLEAATARGQALHFFANHELLAMELMALVLLRFPDAAPDFRAGLARTITEEQAHLRLYRDRMQALGVGLGDVPVNGFFWRTMRDAPTPLDFVVQMALTFEQANLDYCVHYRRLFAEAGDEVSAALLDEVYEDEIGHVKHGVTWFQRWRPEGESDWEAYTRRLPAPLTPARAKGPTLDLRGRRRAGFSEDFVRRLRVYRASKGRRPRLWVFEPSMEDALAGRALTSPAVEALRDDLAPLLGRLASPDDRLVLRHPPRLEHLEDLDRAGFGFPEVVGAEALEGEGVGMAGDLPEALRPWGFTEALAEAAERLTGRRPRMSAIRRFSDKREVRALLQAYLREHGDDPVLGDEAALLGVVAGSVEEVRARHDEGGAWIVKAPFAASGRHRVRLEAGRAPSESELGFVRRAIHDGGSVWMAPWLERIRDFGVTLHVAGGRARFETALWLQNDPKGAYRGHVLAPFLTGLSVEDRRALNEAEDLHARAQSIARFVGRRLAEAGYEGPAGLDMFAFRDPEGRARLHPLVDVNVRYTMGHVAHAVRANLDRGRVGVLEHVTKRRAKALGFDGLAAWAAAARAGAPARRGAHGLVEGVVCLTDPDAAQLVVAALSVAPTVEAAQANLRPAAD